MKSLKVLITTLVLGSSSLALAQPVIRDHRSDSRIEDRGDRFGDRSDGRLDGRSDRRFDGRFDSRFDGRSRFHRNTGPVVLANNLEVDLRRPAYLRLGNDIQRLRFDSDEGHAYIHSLVLVYSNGARRTIDVRQRVTSRSAPLTLDIDSRAVGFYIYAKTRGRGSLDIVGLRR
jgi:hypothetical protein